MSENAAASVAERRSTFATLRHRDFRFFWLGMLFSVFGLSIDFIAAGWLVFELTNSPLSLGATGLFQALPNIAFTALGGTIADRVDRGRLLRYSQSIYALLYLALGTLVITGLVEVWHVYGFAAVFGAVRAFDSPSRQSIVPQLVPQDEIVAGVALINVVWLLPRLAGPALAGIMIATAGIGPTYYVAAAGMALAVLMFAFMRLAGPPPGGSGNVFRSTLEGLEYIRRDSVVLALIGLTFFNSVFGMSYVFLLPVFARDILQVGSEGYGLIQLVGGVGGIIGVLLAARLANSGRQGWLSIAGAFIYGVLLVGFAVSSWFGVSLVINGLISVAHQVYMTIINTVLLLIVADAYRGRVLGVYGLTWSLMPLGAAITGAIAEFAGAPVAVALGGVLIAAVSVLVGILAPRVRQLN
jgi:predicted MFS family arabinose efflux permease